MYNLPNDIHFQVGDVVKYLPNVPHPYGVLFSEKSSIESKYVVVRVDFSNPNRQDKYFLWVRPLNSYSRIGWYFHPSEFEYATPPKPDNSFFD